MNNEYESNELPINANDQLRIGKYKFVIYEVGNKKYGDELAVKVLQEKEESFWLTSHFETWSGTLAGILNWLECQTFMGERIDENEKYQVNID